MVSSSSDSFDVQNTKHRFRNDSALQSDVLLTAAHLAHTFCPSDHFLSPFTGTILV